MKAGLKRYASGVVVLTFATILLNWFFSVRLLLLLTWPLVLYGWAVHPVGNNVWIFVPLTTVVYFAAILLPLSFGGPVSSKVGLILQSLVFGLLVYGYFQYGIHYFGAIGV